MLKSLGLAFILTMLTACGGSGSESNDNNVEKTPPSVSDSSAQGTGSEGTGSEGTGSEGSNSNKTYNIKFNGDDGGYVAYRINRSSNYSDWKNVHPSSLTKIPLNDDTQEIEIFRLCKDFKIPYMTLITESEINQHSSNSDDNYHNDPHCQTSYENQVDKSVHFVAPNGYTFLYSTFFRFYTGEWGIIDRKETTLSFMSKIDPSSFQVSFLLKDDITGDLKEVVYDVDLSNSNITTVHFQESELFEPVLSEITNGAPKSLDDYDYENHKYWVGYLYNSPRPVNSRNYQDILSVSSSTGTIHCPTDKCWVPSVVDMISHHHEEIEKIDGKETIKEMRIYRSKDMVPDLSVIQNTYVQSGGFEVNMSFGGQAQEIQFPIYSDRLDGKKYSTSLFSLKVHGFFSQEDKDQNIMPFYLFNYEVIGDLPSDITSLSMKSPQQADLPNASNWHDYSQTIITYWDLWGTSSYEPMYTDKTLDKHYVITVKSFKE